MQLFRMADPRDGRWARATRVGTWSKGGDVCTECGASGQRRIDPLVIEEEPGNEPLGDFLWPAFDTEIVTKRPIAEALTDRFLGVNCGAVEIHGDRGLRNRDLCSLNVTTWVEADKERSTLVPATKCATCGGQEYELQGSETVEMSWHAHSGELERTRIPRRAGQGIYVSGKLLNKAEVFRVKETSAWIFCSSRVREFIKQRKWRNITFLAIGEIFD